MPAIPVPSEDRKKGPIMRLWDRITRKGEATRDPVTGTVKDSK